jgi:MFS family permease
MTTKLSVERGAVDPMLILVAALTDCTLTVLDTNRVAMVLSTIARNLGASFADVEWIIISYVLCFAALLLPTGAIADRFGRRKVFKTGISILAVALLLRGLASSAGVLYLLRVVPCIGRRVPLGPCARHFWPHFPKWGRPKPGSGVA